MTPTPTVRPALPEDADAFAACHLACWREAYEELWGPERFDEMSKMAAADHVDKEPLAKPFADPAGDVVQQRYRSPGAARVTDEQLDGDCRQKVAEFGEAMRVP